METLLTTLVIFLVIEQSIRLSSQMKFSCGKISCLKQKLIKDNRDSVVKESRSPPRTPTLGEMFEIEDNSQKTETGNRVKVDEGPSRNWYTGESSRCRQSSHGSLASGRIESPREIDDDDLIREIQNHGSSSRSSSLKITSSTPEYLKDEGFSDGSLPTSRNQHRPQLTRSRTVNGASSLRRTHSLAMRHNFRTCNP